MKISANGFTTSPVKRGMWVLDRILGTPPAPPPPDAGAIEPDTRGAVTIREQLDKHRRVESSRVVISSLIHRDSPSNPLMSWGDTGPTTVALIKGLMNR